MIGLLAVACGLPGLAVGSFLNVVIHRVPRGESLVRPRSRCPACRTQIADRDNIPLVSWLVLKGKCRTCGAGISARYPLIEAGTGVAFAVVAARIGYDWTLPAFLVFAAALIAVSAIDLELFIIPKRIVYVAMAVVAALLAFAAAVEGESEPLRNAVVGSAGAWVVLFVVHWVQPKGMGFGDVRLAALIGLCLGWLGPGHVALGLFLAFLIASVVGIALIASGKKGRKDKVPFGPFLACGAVAALLFGRPLLDLYLTG